MNTEIHELKIHLETDSNDNFSKHVDIVAVGPTKRFQDRRILAAKELTQVC